MGGDRELLAQKRVTSILKKHGIATMRTLEQKISDAGPYNQRIDPMDDFPIKQAYYSGAVLSNGSFIA